MLGAIALPIVFFAVLIGCAIDDWIDKKRNEKRCSMIHELKIYPQYFEKVLDGTKTFEVRKNDRDFQVGDTVVLKEFYNIKYSGREITVKITYILDDKFYGVSEGYIVFAFQKV